MNEGGVTSAVVKSISVNNGVVPVSGSNEGSGVVSNKNGGIVD